MLSELFLYRKSSYVDQAKRINSVRLDKAGAD